jgi:hypothetical protein
MALAYNRIVFLTEGRAFVWKSVKSRRKKISVKEACHVSVLAIEQVEEWEQNDNEVTFEIRFNLKPDDGDEFNEVFLIEQVRSGVSADQFVKAVKVPKLTDKDIELHDKLMEYYEQNDIDGFQREMPALTKLLCSTYLNLHIAKQTHVRLSWTNHHPKIPSYGQKPDKLPWIMGWHNHTVFQFYHKSKCL